MTDLPFQPENEFEQVIAAAHRGQAGAPELNQAFAQAKVYVCSKAEVREGGDGFDPLLFGDEDRPLVGVFSALTRPRLYRDAARYVLEVKGSEFVVGLPPRFGMVLNPGYQGSATIARESVALLREAWIKHKI